jgi:hypothetical protein
MTYKMIKCTVFTEENLLCAGRVEGYDYSLISLNTLKTLYYLIAL